MRAVDTAVKPPVAPMLAEARKELPRSGGGPGEWQFEPKWYPID
jgi:ATP-dependent DNA ligase